MFQVLKNPGLARVAVIAQLRLVVVPRVTVGIRRVGRRTVPVPHDRTHVGEAARGRGFAAARLDR